MTSNRMNTLLDKAMIYRAYVVIILCSNVTFTQLNMQHNIAVSDLDLGLIYYERACKYVHVGMTYVYRYTACLK